MSTRKEFPKSSRNAASTYTGFRSLFLEGEISESISKAQNGTGANYSKRRRFFFLQPVDHRYSSRETIGLEKGGRENIL
jgi:hypothetical protein